MDIFEHQKQTQKIWERYDIKDQVLVSNIDYIHFKGGSQTGDSNQ